MKYGCKFRIARINIIAYADDIMLLAHNIQSLNIPHKTYKDLINKSKLLKNEEK